MTDDIVTRTIAGNWHNGKVVVSPDTPYTLQDEEFYKPMTDDIMERLLDFTPLEDADLARLMLDAADEIGRLRASLNIAAGKLSTLPPFDGWHPETIYKALLEDGTEAMRNA